MTICEFLNHYIDRHDTSAAYERQLRVAVRLFAQATGVSDLVGLTAEACNWWLKQLKQQGAADSYRRHCRQHLLVLARSARQDGLAENFDADRVLRVKVADRRPKGWTVAQVRQLIEACDELERRRPAYHPSTGIARRLWWRSYIAARWDTGQDDPTIRSIEREWIPPLGVLSLVRPKTGRLQRVALRPETIAAIDRCMASGNARRLIWPLWGSIESLRKEFRFLLRAAGLTGSLKLLRHSAGSDVERQQPGRGHELIGDTRQVFERHYLIGEIAAGSPLMPTPLEVL